LVTVDVGFKSEGIISHSEFPEAEKYKQQVNARKETEIKTLANLTGWEPNYIRAKIKVSRKGELFPINKPKKKVDWWNKIWPGDDE